MKTRSTPHEWENHHVLQVNREPMHVPLGAYASFDEASSCDRTSSPFRSIPRWIVEIQPGTEPIVRA
ncbi:hypothetical protein AB4Z22_42845, partial [Paenibacillus sp. TAF58]